MKTYFTFFRYSICFLCVFILFGCGSADTVVLTGLDQNTANHILVELSQSNISADKEVDKAGTYSILVPKSEQYHALTVLKQDGSPTPGFHTLGEVFKKDSFISSPLEEQARFMYALEEQISQMVSAIDGVTYVSTQVSLPMPSDNLIGDTVTQQTAASVFIKYKSSYHLEMYTNRIKQLVANSVPGLTPDHVEVLFMEQKDF